MNNKNIQRGAAGLTIEISNGQLILTHLTEGTQLAKCQVAEGTWNELWAAVNFIIGKNAVGQGDDQVVVLNDGETYTSLTGSKILTIPTDIDENDVDTYVKDNYKYGVDIQ